MPARREIVRAASACVVAAERIQAVLPGQLHLALALRRLPFRPGCFLAQINPQDTIGAGASDIDLISIGQSRDIARVSVALVGFIEQAIGYGLKIQSFLAVKRRGAQGIREQPSLSDL